MYGYYRSPKKYESNTYPLIGYIYDEQGKNKNKTWIRSKSDLNQFMSRPVHRAWKRKYEVRITTTHNILVFHLRGGCLSGHPLKWSLICKINSCKQYIRSIYSTVGLIRLSIH